MSSFDTGYFLILNLSNSIFKKHFSNLSIFDSIRLEKKLYVVMLPYL